VYYKVCLVPLCNIMPNSSSFIFSILYLLFIPYHTVAFFFCCIHLIFVFFISFIFIYQIHLLVASPFCFLGREHLLQATYTFVVSQSVHEGRYSSLMDGSNWKHSQVEYATYIDVMEYTGEGQPSFLLLRTK